MSIMLNHICINEEMMPIYIYIYIYCRTLGQIIPKTKKMVFYVFLLNTQYYKVRIKSKWSNPSKEVVLSPTPRCSSYCKGNLQVALEYGRPTYI